MYLFSFLLLLFFGLGKTYLNYNLYIPFANLFILLLLSFPFVFFRNFKIFSLLLLASIITFYTYDTRIYIFFIAIILYIRIEKINFKTIIPIFALIYLMLLISSTRTESNIDYNNFSFFLNSFGAELRDGLFFHDIFSQQQISVLRKGFLYNLVTLFPGWSYFGIIDGDALRSMQLPSILVAELGLDKQGFNGVRVGLLWETFIIFGWIGVACYSVISALMINLCTKLYLSGEIFLSAIIASVNFYSIVGYAYFSISNLSQFILFFLAFYKLLPFILRNAKRVFSNNSI